MNVIEAIQDRRLLGGVFKDPSTWKVWTVFLSALFNLPIEDPEDLKTFSECTGLTEQPKERVKEAAVICGRRSGKSFISAIIAVFLACFKDWSSFLATGERAWIFVVATDRMQARIVQDYIRGILNSSDVLRSMIDQELKEEIHLKNRVSIGIKTSSWRGVRGFNLIAAIAEETAFWRSEETAANPDVEILRALRPSLATIPESLLIQISTIYSRRGTLWETFKKNYGQAGPVFVWKSESLRMNPTLSRKIIEDALKDDPAAARSEWLSEPRQDIEGFLSLELVEACTIPGRRDLPKVDGIQYRAFMDPSSGREDSFAMAIGHAAPDGKIIVDVLRERRPPFAPGPVVEEYAEVLKGYGIGEVVSDKYAAGFVQDLFAGQGIKVKPAELTASEYFLEFLPMLMSSSLVELPDDRHLAAQLTNLERRTRSGGKDLICHPQGLHDDVAVVCAGLAVTISRSKPTRKGRVFIQGRLISKPEPVQDVSQQAPVQAASGSSSPSGPVAELERQRLHMLNIAGKIFDPLRGWRLPGEGVKPAEPVSQDPSQAVSLNEDTNEKKPYVGPRRGRIFTAGSGRPKKYRDIGLEEILRGPKE